MPDRGAKRRVTDARLRALERALREERLALAAITKVMLLECPDPGRVLARLAAMSRAAEANPRTPAPVRKQLLDATLFVKTAIERETGRPQSLFDPDVGHTRAEHVDALVTPTDGEQQLGLVNNEGLLGDVADAHEERVATISRIQGVLVALFEGAGPLTDRELHGQYLLNMQSEPGLPPQSLEAIKARRQDLAGAGRITSRGNGSWDLTERVTA